MYEIFEQLLKERNLTAYKVSKATGVSTATLTSWKQGKYTPKDDKLQKIAKFLGVTLEYLKGIDDYEEVCPICQKRYSPNDPVQVEEHNKYHDRYLNATHKYGELLFFKEREALKRSSYEIINDESSDDIELIAAYENLYKAYFYRSVEYSNFSIFHPDFNKYISMILNQDYFIHNMRESVKKSLIEKYGTSPGLAEGETDCDIHEPKETVLTPKDERDIKKDIDSILEKLSSKEYGPAAYDGEELSEESAALFKDELEIALRRLKLINKEKYNPNKNKK